MHNLNLLKEKSKFIRVETLKIHKLAPETRVASSLSPIEIFVSLYYGNILKYNPKDPRDENRDRFIISKGHGSISMYPLLADIGFFDKNELNNVCKDGSFLGGIPDPIIPGYETVNGSLGHGLGVGSGIAVALKTKQKEENVVVLTGDGELNEGSNWEAIMFAPQQKLDNFTLIVDYNKVSMLDFSKNIINLNSLNAKFEAFNWKVYEVLDGHNIEEVYNTLNEAINNRDNKPKVVIVNTIKGKGVPFLETHALSHILSVKTEDIDTLIEEIENGN
ncbi:Transketolase domain protein [Arcobacter nitrofigilis DSM 7299]|uniref:Transketolase domain protein n=1 Tax=Arcobacter nitrofigilis (strain ATCC 33309 / DSM 7299 / CCUG 15893 / LMG 7604 / NCTC 12251 / CI) TaxID=572480 RepID=D5V7F7_ARCNC|nr:transketolase [Arcobacter nitrofigilis]ADG94577.1 Transketolase domain protein [Arcobacter nitrofigilis DSM 7299]